MADASKLLHEAAYVAAARDLRNGLDYANLSRAMGSTFALTAANYGLDQALRFVGSLEQKL